MQKQIPRGDENLICPLHKEPMVNVCHKCPLWVRVIGADPQTGEHTDVWNCSIALLPTLLIENAQQSRQTGAAVESFRNAMVEQNMVALAMQHRLSINGSGDA